MKMSNRTGFAALLAGLLLGLLPAGLAHGNDQTPESWFNVVDHGATPDESEDDASAIQSALDAAGEAGGGVVYLPRGIYHIGEPLDIRHDGIILHGEGIATELRNNGADEAIIRILSTLHDSEKSFEHVILESFKINGVDRSVTGVMATGLTRGSSLRDLWIEHCHDAMDLTGSWSFSIERNNIVRCDRGGIRLGNVSLDNERRTRNGARVVNAVRIVGNTVRHCAVGLDYHVGHGSHIAGNTFELNDLNVHFKNVGAAAFMGNYLEYNNQVTPLMQIGGPGDPGSGGLVIGGNTFFDREEGVDAIEIHELYNSQIQANRYTVHENNQPVAIGEGADLQNITGNQIHLSRHRERSIPESPDAPGVPGAMVQDGDYLYICVAPDTWKRVEATSWN